MEEEKNEFINILEEFGYEPELAEQVFHDVCEVKKTIRKRNADKYIGKRAMVELNDLQIEIIVKDVKVDDTGKVQFQITPLNGNKHIWVPRLIIK